VNENGYLNPSTKLEIVLRKRTDLTVLIDQVDVTAATYYGTGNAVRTPIDIVLKDLTMKYEFLTLTSQDKMDRVRKNSTKYFVDIPRIVISRVMENQSVTQHPVPIPVGCKMLGLSWMKDEQLYFSSTKAKSLKPHFHLPPRVVQVIFELDGKRLIFERGLTELNHPHWSQSCHDLHQMMVSQGVYSKPFEAMFPSEGMGHDQAFIFNFLYKEFREPSVLNMEVTYTADQSVAGWHLVAITSQQYSFHLKDKEPLKMEVLV
jgi:hypothetical protein